MKVKEDDILRVNNLDSVFGNPTSMLKTYALKYRIGVVVCDLIDITLVVAGTITLGVTAEPVKYFILCFALAIFANLLIAYVTKSDYKEVFLFYRKHKNNPVELKKYNINSENLFATLFCTGCLRIKPDQTVDTYLEILRSVCCQNNKYARKVMKYLSKYESEDGNLEVYIACKNKKQYFVDIKED